ncbi:MAG: hypothetical protein IKQ88_01065 [Lachnospiraceae bacterium]|nr:hypothetical protein [Lachnospiraceae bacterium]
MAWTDKKKIAGLVPAILIPAVFFFFTFLITDHAYILNDDLQLKSLLDGSFSGKPEYKTIYLRVPLAFLLSLLYRFLPGIQFYDILLEGTYLICLLFICFYFSKRNDPSGLNLRSFVIPCICAAAFFAFFLKDMLFLHYTLVAAAAGGTGIFLLSLSEERDERIPAYILLILCDQIREQVFLMFLPFVSVIAGMKLLVFIRAEDKKRVKDFLKEAAIALFVFVVLFLADRAAMKEGSYREYIDYNNARTELYDYTGIWPEEEALSLYESLGVDEDLLAVMSAYDISFDERIDGRLMHKMASYVPQKERKSTGQKIKDTLWVLRKETFSPDDNGVYVLVLIIAWLMMLITAVKEKDIISGVKLAAFICLHFLLYGYLIYRGRYPERVVVSLYLSGIAVAFSHKRPDLRQFIVPVILMALTLPGSIKTDLKSLEDANRAPLVLYSYVTRHPEEIFVTDTYADVDAVIYPCPDNMLHGGGWTSGSPAFKDRLKRFYVNDMEELLNGTASVRFVLKEGVGLKKEELDHYLGKRFKKEDYETVLIEDIEENGCVYHIYAPGE